MTTINATYSFAKQRPLLTGVLAVLAALILGVCIAFAIGLTNPTATHADDLGDDSGIDLGDSGAVDVGTGDTGVDTGIDLTDTGSSDTGVDTGIDLGDNSGTDLGDTSPVDVGTGVDSGTDLGDNTPVDVGTGDGNDPDLGNAADTSTTESPVNTDNNLEPCCTDTIPNGDTDLGNAPDTSTTESPVNTDTNLEPCCTDTTPPVDIPPVETPPVTPPVVLPVVVPPTTPPVIPPPSPVAPTCTLTAVPTTINQGSSSTLSWTSTNATTFTINQGLGSESTSGHTQVTPGTTTTYTGTATGSGGPVNCTTTVTVVTTPPPPPNAPTCTLVAGPSTIELGSSSTLTWQTANATSFTINGTPETPVAGGSISVSPLLDKTYTGVATGPGGTVNCSTTVTVTLIPPPPPVAPTCTLSASPSSINQGAYSTLNWTTTNADTFTIDHHLGSETPVSSGSAQVAPLVTTTYTGTATGSGGTVNCTTTVTVVTTPPPPPNAPACTITANPATINQGDSSTLNWTSTNVTSGTIDNGIGHVATSGSTSVSPNTTTTYTATFTGTNGQTVSCQTTVVVTPPPPPPPPSCTSNCGGGGGGGGQFISFQGVSGQEIIPPAPPVAAAYVSLSQIPYTGLDLGPVGTVIYWITLVLICLAAAYLIIFNLIPFIYQRMQAFGLGVSHVLNQPSGLALASSAGAVATHAAPAGHASAPVTASSTAPAYKSAYSIDQGFRSFAEGNTLTIDDIVKGLAREAAVAAPIAATAAVPMWTTSSQELVAMSETRPTASVAHEAPARAVAPSAPVSTDVRDFVAALLNGDRTTVFSSYRQMIREGGDGETFLTQVVCAIDDAYRARVEGTYVHPEIAQLTANCATPFLEKIASALTNAVDSSYSPGVTGGKLALARALAVVEG